MGTEAQIAKCQEPPSDYLARAREANARLSRGERQRFCSNCKRWKWQDEQCESFKINADEEAIQLYADVMGYAGE